MHPNDADGMANSVDPDQITYLVSYEFPLLAWICLSLFLEFLARLDQVQEELLYYPWRRRWHWRKQKFNVKVYYVMGKALSGELPVHVTGLVKIVYFSSGILVFHVAQSF